jgi:hypothetical protein
MCELCGKHKAVAVLKRGEETFRVCLYCLKEDE